MEQYSQDLFRSLSARIPVTLVANRGGNRHIPWFGLRAWAAGTLRGRAHDLIYIGDAAMAPLGLWFRRLTGRPVVLTVYGLDLTWENRLYQAVFPPLVKHYDAVVCISENTRALALSHGVEAHKAVVIPLGIDFASRTSEPLPEAEWRAKYGVDPDRTSLVIVGRLVERKGAAWLVREVLPRLERDDYQLFVVGSGPHQSDIEQAIGDSDLSGRVQLTGRVPMADRDAFYRWSDLGLMPNIEVDGDAEGFGIAAIEAGSWGLPLLTSGIEGIADAVRPGETAMVYADREECIAKLQAFLDGERPLGSRDAIERAVREHYDWANIAGQYEDLLRRVVNGRLTG